MIAECNKIIAALTNLNLPPNATLEEALELAFMALETCRHDSNHHWEAVKPYTWAIDVIKGNAKQHWNRHHPYWYTLAQR